MPRERLFHGSAEKNVFFCLSGKESDLKNFFRFKKNRGVHFAEIFEFLPRSGRWGNKQRDIENKRRAA